MKMDRAEFDRLIKIIQDSSKDLNDLLDKLDAREKENEQEIKNS
jgi:hypothetical protein